MDSGLLEQLGMGSPDRRSPTRPPHPVSKPLLTTAAASLAGPPPAILSALAEELESPHPLAVAPAPSTTPSPPAASAAAAASKVRAEPIASPSGGVARFRDRLHAGDDADTGSSRSSSPTGIRRVGSGGFARDEEMSPASPKELLENLGIGYYAKVTVPPIHFKGHVF